MDTARIAALLQPYVALNQEQLASISIYIDILMRWNTRINLSAVRRPEEIVTRHFGESFFTAKHVLIAGGRLDVVDVGSGAGFPGLPMALFSPAIRLTLIEANSKKAAFLNEVASALQLANVKVFNGRAEACSATADLVTMRAVEKFETTLPVALRLVRDRGRIALMIGASQIGPVRAFEPEIEWQEPIRMPESQAREIIVGTKRVKVG